MLRSLDAFEHARLVELAQRWDLGKSDGHGGSGQGGSARRRQGGGRRYLGLISAGSQLS